MKRSNTIKFRTKSFKETIMKFFNKIENFLRTTK